MARRGSCDLIDLGLGQGHLAWRCKCDLAGRQWALGTCNFFGGSENVWKDWEFVIPLWRTRALDIVAHIFSFC